MRFIGITGLIGSGKTTLGHILKKQGFVVFDMDDWCRQMYFDRDFLKKIEQTFPYSFKNGCFCKPILREGVFQNNNELQKLEALTHPYLIEKLKKTIHHYRFDTGFCFIQTALLYQMGLQRYFEYVMMLEAPYDVLKKRVMERDKISSNQFENIICQQKNIEKYKKMADFIINTNQNENLLKVEILNLINRIN